MIKNRSFNGLLALTCLTISMACSAGQPSDARRAAMAERIKPVGQVHITGQARKPAVKVVAKLPPTTEQIYERNCIACHDSGTAGAPKFGDKADWEPRANKGLSKLSASVINGIKPYMPPKGGCDACTEAQIQDVVKYMLENADIALNEGK